MSLAARIEIRAERTARRQRVRVGASPCDGDTSEGDGLYTRDAALVWSGKTRSARPARMDKPLRCRPLEGRRDQRSPLRRCFKPRPPLSAGCAGFASGCRLSGSELRRPSLSPSGLESLGFEFSTSLRAAVRPLVRMPTNRHAATGTCEIGRARHKRDGAAMQAFFAAAPIFFVRRVDVVSAALRRGACPRSRRRRRAC